ncbi:MAG TPA: hypothetical protein DCF63_09975 [Planctomycetaceae bacterium]|nr:hypothetical protein [Planctomycetaceae bacterium]
MSQTQSTSALQGMAKIHHTLVEVVVCVVLAFVCVGGTPPGINESHYLPKAKHLADPTFASGGDLFLSSHDSHFLATKLAGKASSYLSLPAVAWLGRVFAWTFMAFAWLRLAKVLGLPGLVRPVAFAGWFLINHYGNWAGEWFLGGFEAKVIAYPLAILGLAAILENRWNLGWIWLGASVAWHPVVGVWVSVTAAGLWFMDSNRWLRLRQQGLAMAIAMVISLVGVLPALGGLGGSDIQDSVSAAQVHVFLRLSHHLLPRSFSMQHHLNGALLLGLLAVATVVYRRYGQSQDHAKATGGLLIVAWGAVGLTMIGILIDVAMRIGFPQILAAKLLRFYWFRWADVIVPLAISVIGFGWLGRTVRSEGKPNMHDITLRGTLYLALAWIMACGFVFGHWKRYGDIHVPPADQLMMQSLGPYWVSWDDLSEVSVDFDGSVAASWLPSETLLPQRYVDWLAVCRWIQENTPADSLWLTPPYQQTFKWYAGRAEVVCWKDVPQDNAAIIQWYRRLQRCKLPRQSDGKPRGWNTDELIDLAREYRFQWILVDRTYQDQPPLLESKYPLLVDNRSFAVFYISPRLLESSDRTTKNAEVSDDSPSH